MAFRTVAGGNVGGKYSKILNYILRSRFERSRETSGSWDLSPSRPRVTGVAETMHLRSLRHSNCDE